MGKVFQLGFREVEQYIRRRDKQHLDSFVKAQGALLFYSYLKL